MDAILGPEKNPKRQRGYPLMPRRRFGLSALRGWRFRKLNHFFAGGVVAVAKNAGSVSIVSRDEV